MTFALYFGNRGFMPAELIESARDDMVKAVTDAGYDYIMMDKDATRYGAVETRDEGRIYAKWLKSHEGEYDGVILCMPIFVDENGAITALQDAGVPSLECIDCTVVTGSQILEDAKDFIPFDFKVSEVTAHVAGARHFYPNCCAILDVGGQDSKAMVFNEKMKMKIF